MIGAKGLKPPSFVPRHLAMNIKSMRGYIKFWPKNRPPLIDRGKKEHWEKPLKPRLVVEYYSR